MLNRIVYQSSDGQIIAPRSAHLLITTFDTWLPHQRSNAADDLVQQAIDRRDLPQNTLVIRHLPVDNVAASQPVCNYIDRFRPAVVLCCGMAESRSCLSLERQAHLHGHTRQTMIPLKTWCDGLPVTEISHDAGQFVCNYLYYHVLERCAALTAIEHPPAQSRSPIAAQAIDRPSPTPIAAISGISGITEIMAIASHALFLHVPPLTSANHLAYAQDFASIITACQTLAAFAPASL